VISVVKTTRNINRCPHRNTLRPSTRMLDGVRRPSPPNYLSIACRAFEEVIRIDKRLRPYMEEQTQLLDQWRRDQEIQAALRKIYGDPCSDNMGRTSGLPAEGSPGVHSPESSTVPNRREAALLLKQELALANSRLVLDNLRGKLKIR
jgi:hypothetical protein